MFAANNVATAQDQTTTLTYSAWMPPPLQECGPLRVLKAIEAASSERLRFEPSDVKPAAPGKVYQQLVDGAVDVLTRRQNRRYTL